MIIINDLGKFVAPATISARRPGNEGMNEREWLKASVRPIHPFVILENPFKRIRNKE